MGNRSQACGVCHHAHSHSIISSHSPIFLNFPRLHFVINPFNKETIFICDSSPPTQPFFPSHPPFLCSLFFAFFLSSCHSFLLSSFFFLASIHLNLVWLVIIK